MKNVSVIVNKGESTRTFSNIRSTNLVLLVEKITELNLSLTEAEEKANVQKGVILNALEKNDMLAPMDAYHLSEAL
jgi:hypothetical protein